MGRGDGKGCGGGAGRVAVTSDISAYKGLRRCMGRGWSLSLDGFSHRWTGVCRTAAQHVSFQASAAPLHLLIISNAEETKNYSVVCMLYVYRMYLQNTIHYSYHIRNVTYFRR